MTGNVRIQASVPLGCLETLSEFGICPVVSVKGRREVMVVRGCCGDSVGAPGYCHGGTAVGV